MANKIHRVPNKPWDKEPPIPLRTKRPGKNAQGVTIQIDYCDETLEWLRSARTVPHAGMWTDMDWHELNRLSILMDQIFSGEETRGTIWSEVRAINKGLWLGAERANHVDYIDEDESDKGMLTQSQLDAIARQEERRKRLES